MRKLILAVAALAVCLMNTGRAESGELHSRIEQRLCNLDQCLVTFDVDFLFLSYYQSGGVQSSDAGNLIGNNENVEFDFNLSPRFTLGLQHCSGLGTRFRYWFYDQSAPTVDGGGFVAVDAYTFDAEIFKRLQLGRSTLLEGFGGVRWSEYNLSDDTDLDWRVDGVGVTTGFQFSQKFCRNHRLYAGTRLAVMVGDVNLINDGDLDDTSGVAVDGISLHTELSVGYEGMRDLGSVTLVYGAGAELQNWSDAAVKNDASDEGYLADAGWGGFMFRLGARY